MDLSPREDVAAPVARRKGTKWPAITVLVLVLVGGAVVVTKFLTSSIDYYCNVDEVGEKDGCDAGERFRVQGVVDEGTVEVDGDVTTFTISFNGRTIPVRYQGDPGGLFQECIPVVVRGELGDDGLFAGNQLEVKHSNEYEAENKDRIEESNDESAACEQLKGT